jgi:hypothetical protein
MCVGQPPKFFAGEFVIVDERLVLIPEAPTVFADPQASLDSHYAVVAGIKQVPPSSFRSAATGLARPLGTPPGR